MLLQPQVQKKRDEQVSLYSWKDVEWLLPARVVDLGLKRVKAHQLADQCASCKLFVHAARVDLRRIISASTGGVQHVQDLKYLSLLLIYTNDYKDP